MTENKLQKALMDFENPASTKTFIERLSELRQALIWEAFSSIKTLSKNGVEDDLKRTQYQNIMEYFKDIEKLYANDVKINKLTKKKESDLDSDFFNRIKDMKSTVGEIVRDLK